MQTPSNSDEFVHVTGLLAAIRRQALKIVLFTVFATGVAIAIVTQMQPTYRSTSTLLIENELPSVMSLKDSYRFQSPNEEYILTQTEIMRSRELADRVIDELDLLTHPAYQPDDSGLRVQLKQLMAQLKGGPSNQEASPDRRALVREAFLDHLSVAPVKKTQLAKIAFDSPDPQLSAEVANAVADLYLKNFLQVRSDASDKTSSWVVQRLEELKLALESSEAALQDYRESEQLIDISGVKTVDAESLSALTQQYLQARRAADDKKVAYEQLKKLGASPTTDALLTIPAILVNPLVESLREAEAEADKKVAELGKRYGPKHPKMIAALSEATAAGDSVRKQVEAVAATIQNDYLAAAEAEKNLHAQLQNAKDKMQNLNRKELRLVELEREVANNRDMYNLFLAKEKENGELSSVPTLHARVVDRAVPALYPSKPNKKMIVGLTAGGSGLAAFMLVLIGAAMRRENPQEVMPVNYEAIRVTPRHVTPNPVAVSKLDERLIGFLPNVKSNLERIPYIGPPLDVPSPFSDAIKSMRTGLYLTIPAKRPVCTIVTSNQAKEGKSTVALNMALALAKTDRVLLIDADPVRPSLGITFGIPSSSPGLYNLIAGVGDIAECIHAVEGTSLDVMPAGFLTGEVTINGYPIRDNAELLSSRAFGDTLRNLKSMYTHLILDASSVPDLQNSPLLSLFADSVLFVIDTTTTTSAQAAQALHQLKRVRAPVSGVILNRVDVEKVDHFEQYYREFYQGSTVDHA